MIQIPWKTISIAIFIVLLVFILFIRRKRERLEPGNCTSAQDEIDGACYEKCREGFSSVGANCYEVCDSNEKSEGLSCISSDGKTRNIMSYTRNKIVDTFATDERRQMKQPECSNNYEPFSTFCVEKCKEGFSKYSIFCFKNCPKSSKDMGLVCTDNTKETLKETYIPKTMFSANLNTSNLMACMDEYTRLDAMCIQNCSPDHILVGALCVEKCKSDETDLGTMCLKGQIMRKKDITTPGISEVPVKT